MEFNWKFLDKNDQLMLGMTKHLRGRLSNEFNTWLRGLPETVDVTTMGPRITTASKEPVDMYYLADFYLRTIRKTRAPKVEMSEDIRKSVTGRRIKGYIY